LLCNKAEWILAKTGAEGKIDSFYVELHGLGNSLHIKGSSESPLKIKHFALSERYGAELLGLSHLVIGNIVGNLKPKILQINDVTNKSKECTFDIREVQLFGFANLGDRLSIRALEISMSPVNMGGAEHGIFELNPHSSIKFFADEHGFAGRELYINMQEAQKDKSVMIPYREVNFSKIVITNASSVVITGTINAEQLRIIDCPLK
jgi:hypothetical protein